MSPEPTRRLKWYHNPTWLCTQVAVAGIARHEQLDELCTVELRCTNIYLVLSSPGAA